MHVAAVCLMYMVFLPGCQALHFLRNQGFKLVVFPLAPLASPFTEHPFGMFVLWFSCMVM